MHKAQHQKNLENMGRDTAEQKIRKKINQRLTRTKVDPSKVQPCQVGKLLKYNRCKKTAYRKLRWIHGNLYTCDNCAARIAKINEHNTGIS